MYSSIAWQNPSLSSKRSAGFLSSFRYNPAVPLNTRYLQAHLQYLGISTPNAFDHFQGLFQPTFKKYNSPNNNTNSEHNQYLLPLAKYSNTKISFPGFMESRREPAIIGQMSDGMNKSGDIAELFIDPNNSRLLSPKRTIYNKFLQWKTTLGGFHQTRLVIPQTIPQTDEPVQQSSEIKNWMNSFGAGFFAGTVARTTTAPFDRLKFIYMLYYKGLEKPPSILTGFKEIVKREGFKGLFKGNMVCILKASPESAIRLTIFEKLKSIIKDKKAPNLDKKKLFIVGGFSGALANLAIFPMDVLRTRLAADKNGLYKGMLDAIKKIAKTEGLVRPFYRGANCAVIANVPTSGLNLMLYEALKEVVIARNPEKTPPAFAYMGCAGISALVTCSIMFPLQMVTSRLIMRSTIDKENVSKGMVHQIKKIYTSEGVRGFYKGYCPGTSKVILGNAMLFGCYEFMKRTLGIEFKKH